MLLTTLLACTDLTTVQSVLENRGIPKTGIPATHEDALKLALRVCNPRTQQDSAIMLLDLTASACGPEKLVELLKLTNPQDTKIGERHGPHYLSLARTGKIKTMVAPGRKNSSAVKEEISTTPNPRIAELEAELVKERDFSQSCMNEVSDMTNKLEALQSKIGFALADGLTKAQILEMLRA